MKGLCFPLKQANKQKIHKTPETVLNEIETSALSDKEFKVMVIKMLTELRRRMGGHSEIFNEETENVKKLQTKVTELKNIIKCTEKYTREVQ